MKKILIILIIIILHNFAHASPKENIIKNLKNINNLSFDFEQNVNGKIENGNCIIEYPKKIFCNYNNLNNKLLVSNGKSLVIKTKGGSYYRYSIKKTPLFEELGLESIRIMFEMFPMWYRKHKRYVKRWKDIAEGPNYGSFRLYKVLFILSFSCTTSSS